MYVIISRLYAADIQLYDGVEKNRLLFAMERRNRHACPGKNGSKCVEVTPPMIFDEIWIGCVRDAIRVSPAILHQREHAKSTNKESIVELKKLAQLQLHDGLNERLPYLRGITDPLPICKAISVDKEDFFWIPQARDKCGKKETTFKVVWLCG